MNEELLMTILDSVRRFDYYFLMKKVCTGISGFSSIQRCTTAMRVFVYRFPGDTKDEYLHMSESTSQYPCTNSLGPSSKSLGNIG
jgi:hypothetical protein